MQMGQAESDGVELEVGSHHRRVDVLLDVGARAAEHRVLDALPPREKRAGALRVAAAAATARIGQHGKHNLPAEHVLQDQVVAAALERLVAPMEHVELLELAAAGRAWAGRSLAAIGRRRMPGHPLVDDQRVGLLRQIARRQHVVLEREVNDQLHARRTLHPVVHRRLVHAHAGRTQPTRLIEQ